MKSKYAGSCPKCQKEWKVDDEILISKSSDGGWIKCSDKQCFESQGGKISEGSARKSFVSQKFPITESERIYDKAELILDSFKTKRKDQEDTLTIAEEAVFIESLVRTLSGNFKP